MRFEVPIPEDLRGRLPRLTKESADARIAIGVDLILFGLLYYLLTRVHNGWLYFLPALLGPNLSSLFLMFRSWNPYRSYAAKLDGLKELDIHGDPAALRLVTLLSSPNKKRVLLVSGLTVSAFLCVLAWGFASAISRPLQWSFSSDHVVIVIGHTLLFAVLSLVVHCYVLLQWAFRSWNRGS